MSERRAQLEAMCVSLSRRQQYVLRQHFFATTCICGNDDKTLNNTIRALYVGQWLNYDFAHYFLTADAIKESSYTQHRFLAF